MNITGLISDEVAEIEQILHKHNYLCFMEVNADGQTILGVCPAYTVRTAHNIINVDGAEVLGIPSI